MLNPFRVFIAIMAGLLVLPTGCKKDTSNIPSVTVDLYVYLSQPNYAVLNAVGGWMPLNGGVKGIIIYRRSNDEFAAYERSCTYDPTAANARIDVDSSNVIGVDHNCGSKFSLIDNSILNGPATRPLKTYYCDYDVASQTVHVHN